MHFSALLALAVATSTVSGCTFGVVSERTTDTAGGGSLSCGINIWPKDYSSPWNGPGAPYKGFSKDIECSSGCNTVQYRGRTWKFCHSGLTPDKVDLENTEITLRETDNDGNLLNISPKDGESSNDSDEGPFSSYQRNKWFRNGIHC